MITMPSASEIIIAPDFFAEHPTGSTIKLTTNFIVNNCGIFNPSIGKIADADWEILNYYYIVGSRGTKMVGLVVGVEYDMWATMQTNSIVTHRTYASLSPKETFWLEEDPRIANGNKRLVYARLKSKINPYRRKHAVMVVTKKEDMVLT